MRCESPNCLNDAAPRRKICYKCKTRQQRVKNPIMVTYHDRKKRANQRGISFTITFDEFKKWCLQNNYIELKGKGADDMTIDRIKNELGYANGNLQMISNSANSKKRYSDARRKKWDSQNPPGFVDLSPPAPF